MAIAGDCSFARGIQRRAQQHGYGVLLGDAANVLRAADLAIVNLESPLAPCLPGGSVNRPRLCGRPEAVSALAAAGIDAVTVANNHALDAGEHGLDSTVATLEARGIRALGAGSMRGAGLDAERIGEVTIIAANLTPAAHPPGSEVEIPGPGALSEAVRRAATEKPAVPVLVLLHLGREFDPYAQPRDGRYARAAVAGGAAAVIMHGAHVIRPLVYDRGVPVHLGLGNLLFDQRRRDARQGAIITLSIEPGRPAAVADLACVESGQVVRCEKPVGHHRR